MHFRKRHSQALAGLFVQADEAQTGRMPQPLPVAKADRGTGTSRCPVRASAISSAGLPVLPASIEILKLQPSCETRCGLIYAQSPKRGTAALGAASWACREAGTDPNRQGPSACRPARIPQRSSCLQQPLIDDSKDGRKRSTRSSPLNCIRNLHNCSVYLSKK